MSHGTIVVTGAHGFLGRHVARLLAQKGSAVVGIGHGEWQQEEWQGWGLRAWHHAHITLDALRQLPVRPSSIIHCAGGGSVAYSVTDPLADFERTVVSTAHVLEYVRLHAPLCSVVYPSSASVYGTVEAVPIREDCPPGPISQYGTHKLMAEEMVSSYGRQFGVAVSIVRFFSVYGCGLRKQLLWDACCKLAKHDAVFMGTGQEIRDWLHVDDAAKLLLAATHHASAECLPVNGGSGVGITVQDLLQHLSHSLNANSTPIRFSGVQRIGDPSRYVANCDAAKAWGWEPKKPLMQGVEEYAAWWVRSNS